MAMKGSFRGSQSYGIEALHEALPFPENGSRVTSSKWIAAPESRYETINVQTYSYFNAAALERASNRLDANNGFLTADSFL